MPRLHWNYLKAIMLMQEMLEVQPISARAQAFYYCLLSHMNRAHGAYPLSVAESTLRGELKLNHDQFIRTRRELVEAEYIRIVSAGGRKACLYFLCESLDTEQEGVF